MTDNDETCVCDICGDTFDSEEERKEHIYAVHELQQEDA